MVAVTGFSVVRFTPSLYKLQTQHKIKKVELVSYETSLNGKFISCDFQEL